MNRGGKWNMEGEKKIWLIRELSKKKAFYPDVNDKRCEECYKRDGPCIDVVWVNEGVEGEKIWRLVERTEVMWSMRRFYGQFDQYFHDSECYLTTEFQCSSFPARSWRAAQTNRAHACYERISSNDCSTLSHTE